jgi:hypothetical protein
VCGLCRSNCFTPEKYRMLAQIMKYSRPRTMVRHPILTMAHLCDVVRWRGSTTSRPAEVVIPIVV